MSSELKGCRKGGIWAWGAVRATAFRYWTERVFNNSEDSDVAEDNRGRFQCRCRRLLRESTVCR